MSGSSFAGIAGVLSGCALVVAVLAVPHFRSDDGRSGSNSRSDSTTASTAFTTDVATTARPSGSSPKPSSPSSDDSVEPTVDTAASADVAPSGLSTAEIETFAIDCADYIDIKHELNDPFAVDTWNNANGDRATIEQECRRIATEDRGSYDLLSIAIIQLDEFFEGASGESG